MCRLVPVPTPTDAVVLQTLVESIYPAVKEKQPSQNAFYSRTHQKFVPEIEVDDAGYFWFTNWKKFSDRLYEFSSAFPYLIVTDLVNFFDNIEFRRLRNTLSALGAFDEKLIDLLFLILEQLLWRPDYLPLSGKGLPQLDFDAPRLLSHAFLFPADKFLEERSGGNFVRWVDDIDVAMQRFEDCKLLLRDFDELLMKRGLRLNTGKTKILDAAQAKIYLLPDENRFLSVLRSRIDRLLSEGKPITNERRLLAKRFRKFLKKNTGGRWDKVYKRYFTTFGHIGSKQLQQYVPQLLRDMPSVREAVFRYYTTLGPSQIRLEHLRDYIEGEHCLDDVSAFAACRVMTDWAVPPSSALRKEICDLAVRLHAREGVHLLCAVWLLAKYGTRAQLGAMIRATRNIWRNSPFHSRQIAALTPRLRSAGGVLRSVKDTLLASGQLDAVNVIINLNGLRSSGNLTKADRLYILHGEKEFAIYPLQKFLIAMDVLRSTQVSVSQKKQLKDNLMKRVKDPLYLHYFRRIAV